MRYFLNPEFLPPGKKYMMVGSVKIKNASFFKQMTIVWLSTLNTSYLYTKLWRCLCYHPTNLPPSTQKVLPCNFCNEIILWFLPFSSLFIIHLNEREIKTFVIFVSWVIWCLLWASQVSSVWNLILSDRLWISLRLFCLLISLFHLPTELIHTTTKVVIVVVLHTQWWLLLLIFLCHLPYKKLDKSLLEKKNTLQFNNKNKNDK